MLQASLDAPRLLVIMCGCNCLCITALRWSPYPFYAKHLKHLELHLPSLLVKKQHSTGIENKSLIYSYQPWGVALELH